MKASTLISTLVIACSPSIAAANSKPYEAGYALGASVARAVDTYGPYLRYIALAGVIGWLVSRRAKAKRRRDIDA
ncbi:MAG: hypothetical protein ACREPD_03200 [Stenotrophomonas sp.]|uniref:hypothetical protein n=1 Tax=Stenotrophomonas sp. TaxID=69392 RepID=UPI003D6C87EA